MGDSVCERQRGRKGEADVRDFCRRGDPRRHAGHLSDPDMTGVDPDSIVALRPFVPAKDFALSQKFYAALGFQAEPLGKGLVEMHMGRHSFLLQNYYVKEWAANFVMHMLVDGLDDW